MEVLGFILAADIWSQWLWPILLLVIGLGLVIFVHELGHFLVAKLVGIKVERFALGFGPRVLSFKAGETDYCLCALPLGGYIKMLGQEDFKPLAEEQQVDPRSYQGKSVGARFAVIAAGVVMNVILAAVLFVVVGLVGKEFPAAIVGGASEGYPAANAEIVWQDTDKPASSKGLQPGDKILAMEGDSVLLWLSSNRISHFQEVAITAALADPDDEYTFTIQREVNGKKRIGKAKTGVKQSFKLGMFLFGISQAADIIFDKPDDLITDSRFNKNDRIVKIAGQEIEHSWQLQQIAEKLTGKPVIVTVQRKDKQEEIKIQPVLLNSGSVFCLKDGRRIRGKVVDYTPNKDPKLAIFTVATKSGETEKFQEQAIEKELLVILGMVPRIKVLGVDSSGVFSRSPAYDADLKPGDIIIGYGDHGAPSFRQMLDINEEFVDKGTNIVVQRGSESINKWIVPKERESGAKIGIARTVDLMNPVVARVLEGSPAAKAGLEPGARIRAINKTEVNNWIDVFNALKALSGKKVKITYQLGVQKKTVEIGKLDDTKFDASDYQFAVLSGEMPLKTLQIRIQKKNPLTALAWGGRETLRMILSTYVSLRSLILGNVSAKSLSGPVGIGSLAIKVGRDRPLVDFVYFLAFISTALAVFNFLPLPVVDGGHAVFLLIEKVRGKPISVKIMNIVQMIGLVLILLLFVVLTWNDIAKWMKELW